MEPTLKMVSLESSWNKYQEVRTLEYIYKEFNTSRNDNIAHLRLPSLAIGILEILQLSIVDTSSLAF